MAVLALAVSAGALYLDYRYKELSIRPVVATQYDGEGFTVAIKNVGLGPAEISRMVFFFDGTCFELDRLTPLTTAKLRAHLTKHLYIDVIKRSGAPIELPIPGGVGVHVLFELNMTPWVLNVGHTWKLVSLSVDQAKRLSEKLSELGATESTAIHFAFLGAFKSLPMAVSYCSMTGRDCVTQQIVNCPRPNPRKG